MRVVDTEIPYLLDMHEQRKSTSAAYALGGHIESAEYAPVHMYIG